MIETMTNAPICKTQICKRPLTYLEKQGCWRCLVCNPLPKDAPKPIKEKKFLDVKMTEVQVAEMITKKLAEQVEIGEERIREIVINELENWHIQKPPVTQNEIMEAIETEKDISPDKDWRQQAKDLGIELFHRTKADVLAEIEAKTTLGNS